MTYLSVSNLKKMYGDELLFDGVSFSITDKDRACIVGTNGTGKTTLLKLILKMEEPSNDLKNPYTISIPKEVKVGYLSQDVIEDINNTLIEEALLVFKETIKIENKINELTEKIAKYPESAELLNEYSVLSQEFENKRGYSYKYEIETILTKFGFSKDELDRQISSFSGGERSKVAFAKLLLEKPDLLILDEPTNHLDVSTIDWLEGFLKNYNGAILFVSHDKYFINNVANLILNLEYKKVTQYRGNFDFYVAQKEQNYKTQLKAYTIQQREIEKMERFIEYFKPKPRFVARAKDREKKLEHMVKIEKPKESKKAISFDFSGETRSDKKILYFNKLEIGYSSKKLANPLDLLVFGGDKIAIMGDNGVGKTTLLKTILRLIPPLKGEIRELMNLRYGYIKQNDFDIKGVQTVFQYLHDLFPYMENKDVRTHLGRFDFKGDDVMKSLDFLSGGEKMRFILAKLALEKYDVLILDEPTNNLDMETRESLISALQDFNSCIFFVSHDRYFIDLVANKILYFSNKNIEVFDGSYTEFKQQKSEDSQSNLKNNENNKQNYKNKHSKNIPQKISMRIKQIEVELKTVDQELGEAENTSDYKKINELAKTKERLEEEYLSLMLEYE